MSAVIANHSQAQRASVAAGIVILAGPRWGLSANHAVEVAARHASHRVLQGQSVAGAVAAARRTARAQGGAA